MPTKIVKEKSDSQTIKVLSLFSGCGGLDLGFEEVGDYKTVWANDINEWAAKTFRRHFGNVISDENIEEIDPQSDRRIPKCDLIIGGFPCQDFSIIWKQPGLNGERGNLYKNFLRFIDAKRPKAFVAENVKGLLTANDGKAVRQIIEDFSKIGPGYMVKIQLYNFAEYGVPQFRERVLLVGIRLDTGFNFIHPAPTHGPRGKIPYVTVRDAFKDVEKVVANNERMNITERTKKRLEKIPEGGNFTDIPKDDPLYVKGMISHVYRRINRNEPSTTIIAAGGGGTWGYHYPEPRPLTNRERARIQTFPDDFIFEGSITEVRRQIGNAVPPKGVRLVAEILKPLFLGAYEKKDIRKIDNELQKMSIRERLEFDYKQRGAK